MTESKKFGQRKDLDSLDLALSNREKINERIDLLHSAFEKGEINYLEYKELLDNFKDIHKDYTAHIEDFKKPNKSIPSIAPLVLILLISSLVFVPLFANQFGLTGAIFSGEHSVGTGFSINWAPANLSCSVRQASCDPGEVGIMRMSNTSNAHAALISDTDYNYLVCCADFDSKNQLTNSSGFNLINLSSTTDAHAELPSSADYPYGVFIGASIDGMDCTYENVSGSCSSTKTCLMTLSNYTNAHVADCVSDPYNLSVCCEFNISNLVPSTTQVILNSTGLNYTSSDDLTCYAEGYDEDNTNLTAYFTWYRDGADAGIGGSTSITNGTLSFISKLSDSGTPLNASQIWKCSVLMGDGLANATNWTNSTGVEIGVSCGDILQANQQYILTANISSATSCISVFNNTEIDCQGYSISGSNNGVGINAVNQNNLTIKNCNFFNFNQDIVFDNVDDSLIDTVDIVINITDSDGNNITNSTVEALYITNSTNIQVINSTVANYTFDYVRNLTIDQNYTYGKIKFIDNVTESGLSLDGDILVGNNRVFINSTSKPGLNVSAEVTLKGLLWSGVKIIVSAGGNYTDCNSTTSPSCSVLSYNLTTGTAVFNVSGFSAYKTKSNYTWDYTPGTGSLSNISHGSICVGDIDGDNDTDIFLNGKLVNASSVSEIYLNNGSGYFTFNSTWSASIPGMNQSDCAMSDLNRDKRLDLGVCGQLENGSNVTYIYNNTGSGYTLWQELNSSGADCSISFGDIFPVDGRDDIDTVGNEGGRTEKGDGNGFTQKTGTNLPSGGGSKTQNKIDINNDKLPDDFKSQNTPSGQMSTNDGDDTFTATTDVGGPYIKFSGSKVSALHGDFNNDGFIDIVWSGWDASGSLQAEVWLNNGDGTGTFTENVAAGASLPHVAAEWTIGDYNADGNLDLMAMVDDEAVATADIYYGDGSGGFTASGQYPGNNPLYNFFNGDTVTTDLNGDGILDFIGNGDILTENNGPCLIQAPGICNGIFCSDTGLACSADSDCYYCTVSGPGSGTCSGDADCKVFGQNSLIALGDNVDVNAIPNDNSMACSVSYNSTSSIHTLNCSGATDADSNTLAMIVDANNITGGNDLFTRSTCGYGSDTPQWGCGIMTLSNTGSFTALLNVGDVPLQGTIYVTDGVSRSDGFAFYESFSTIDTAPTSIDAGTVSGDDCYISSDLTQPGNDPTACLYTGSWPSINLSIYSTQNYNLTVHYSKNITTEFAAGTLNNNLVGKLVNLSSMGGGNILATGYLNGNYNDSLNKAIMLVKNVTNAPAVINYTLEHGKEFDVLTPKGTYNNTLTFTVWI